MNVNKKELQSAVENISVLASHYVNYSIYFQKKGTNLLLKFVGSDKLLYFDSICCSGEDTEVFSLTEIKQLLTFLKKSKGEICELKLKDDVLELTCNLITKNFSFELKESEMKFVDESIVPERVHDAQRFVSAIKLAEEYTADDKEMECLRCVSFTPDGTVRALNGHMFFMETSEEWKKFYKSNKETILIKNNLASLFVKVFNKTDNIRIYITDFIFYAESDTKQIVFSTCDESYPDWSQFLSLQDKVSSELMIDCRAFKEVVEVLSETKDDLVEFEDDEMRVCFKDKVYGHSKKVLLSHTERMIYHLGQLKKIVSEVSFESIILRITGKTSPTFINGEKDRLFCIMPINQK